MSQPAGPAGEPDESLVEAFWSLTRSMRQASQESMAQWDITPSQARALRVIARHRALRPSELSDHLRIAARSATEVIDDLEAKGLIARRPDPSDRRATLVELTDSGVQLGEKMRGARGAQAERLFDRLSAADRTELTRILQQLRAADGAGRTGKTDPAWHDRTGEQHS